MSAGESAGDSGESPTKYGRMFDNRKEAVEYAQEYRLPLGRRRNELRKLLAFRYCVGRFSPYHYVDITPKFKS